MFLRIATWMSGHLWRMNFARSRSTRIISSDESVSSLLLLLSFCAAGAALRAALGAGCASSSPGQRWS
jgi:hypothetical protein